MKKAIIIILGLAIMASVTSAAFGRTMEEEKKAVQDFLVVIDAKLVKAKKAGQYSKVTALRAQKAATLARWNKLKASLEVTTVATPAAVVAPVPVVVKPVVTHGLFGWGMHSTLAAQYINDGKSSTIYGSSGLMANLVIDDVIGLGPLLHMSADIVKYKIGMGGFYVYGAGGIKAVPVYAGGILYLPQWLGGQESYLTGGLNYVVTGNGSKPGKIGGDIYFGIATDFGFGLGKTGFEFGYNVVRSNTITSKGPSFSVSQSINL